jgi:hypothetical protein
MKHICILFRLAVVIFAATASIGGTRSAAAASVPQGQESLQRPAPRTVDLKAADGTPLKATYFAAARPGPGVLLFHQVNRTRKSWDVTWPCN